MHDLDRPGKGGRLVQGEVEGVLDRVGKEPLHRRVVVKSNDAEFVFLEGAHSRPRPAKPICRNSSSPLRAANEAENGAITSWKQQACPRSSRLLICTSIADGFR